MGTVECCCALPWRQFARLCSLATILVLVSAAPRLAGQAPPLLTELSYPFGGIVNGNGSSPISVAIGDFNGDGVPDAAVLVFGIVGTETVTSQIYSQIYIYLGNGDGTFQFPLVIPIGAVQGTAILSGDFNGDGKADLCITLINSTEILVLLGNGDGTFQAPITDSLGSTKLGVYGIVTGDFNGDGKLDLVAAIGVPGTSSDVYFAPGNGDGTFSTPVQLTQTGNSGGSALATADFRQNGDLDLVFNIPGGFGVVLGDGKGGFSAVTPYDFQDGVWVLRIADFNGDGVPDIFAGAVNGNSLAVFLGVGDGTFGAGIITTVNNCCDSGDVAADFNGDGFADYFYGGDGIAGTPSTFIMFGNGDGTFQAAQNLGLSFGSSWKSVAVDLNGDGKLDLAIADAVDGRFSVILNTPGSTGLTLAPQAYDFGNLTQGSTALPPTTITIGNPGTAPLNITNAALDDTTDFSFTNSCTAPVQPNATCTLAVTFNPQSLGTKSAKLTFTSGDPLAGANYIQLV